MCVCHLSLNITRLDLRGSYGETWAMDVGLNTASLAGISGRLWYSAGT